MSDHRKQSGGYICAPSSGAGSVGEKSPGELAREKAKREFVGSSDKDALTRFINESRTAEFIRLANKRDTD